MAGSYAGFYGDNPYVNSLMVTDAGAKLLQTNSSQFDPASYDPMASYFARGLGQKMVSLGIFVNEGDEAGKRAAALVDIPNDSLVQLVVDPNGLLQETDFGPVPGFQAGFTQFFTDNMHTYYGPYENQAGGTSYGELKCRGGDSDSDSCSFQPLGNVSTMNSLEWGGYLSGDEFFFLAQAGYQNDTCGSGLGAYCTVWTQARQGGPATGWVKPKTAKPLHVFQGQDGGQPTDVLAAIVGCEGNDSVAFARIDLTTGTLLKQLSCLSPPTSGMNGVTELLGAFDETGKKFAFWTAYGKGIIIVDVASGDVMNTVSDCALCKAIGDSACNTDQCAVYVRGFAFP